MQNDAKWPWGITLKWKFGFENHLEMGEWSLAMRMIVAGNLRIQQILGVQKNSEPGRNGSISISLILYEPNWMRMHKLDSEHRVSGLQWVSNLQKI